MIRSNSNARGTGPGLGPIVPSLSSLGHAPRVKTGFDFLDDRAEDGVDLEILGRVDRRDAGRLQSRHVRGRNDAADNQRHVFEAGRA